MRAIVIARFANEKSREFTGVRLLRLPDRVDDIIHWQTEVSDISINKLRTVLKNKLIDIVNTKLKGNTIIGKDNTFRYSEIISDNGNGTLLNPGILTILYKITDGDAVRYLVANSSGTIKAIEKDRVESDFTSGIKYTNLFIRNGVIQTTAPEIVRNKPKSNNEYTDSRIVNGQYKLKYEINVDDLIYGYKDKYSKYTHKISAREIMEKQLTDVPAELVDFWTVEEFKSFMDEHNLIYRIIPHNYSNENYIDITELDSRLKVLVAPSNTVVIHNFLCDAIPQDEYSSIVSLYLPDSMESVTDDLILVGNSLKNVVMSNKTKTMPINRIIGRMMNLGIHFNIPYYIEELYGIFGGMLYSTKSEICNIDLSILPHIVKVNSCFNDLRVDSIKFGYTQILDDSFKRAVASFNTLTLGKFIKHVEGQSFLALDVNNINFANASGLETIDYSSFCNLSNIDTIDLSNNLRLETISSNAFSDCASLKEVKLPVSLRTIDDRAFSGCPNLKTVNIPDLVRIRDYAFRESSIELLDVPVNSSLGIVNLSKTHAVLNTDELLKFGRITRCTFKTLELKGNLKKIGYQALLSCSVEQLILTESLEKIGEEAFYGAKLQQILDIRNLKKLKEIQEKAFANTNISKVILPDGLEEIWDMAFSQCEYLEAIYIPGSLKTIGKRLFLKSSSRVPFKFTLYTQAGSEVYNYFNSKVNVIYVQDADEAYEKITEQRRISDAKLSKLKIILGNDPKHKLLFTPKFEDSADKLYDIYKLLSAKQGVTLPNVRDIQYNNSIKLSKIIGRLNVEGIDLQSITSEIRYSNFVGVYRFIQRIRENDLKILSDETLDKLQNQGYTIRITNILENDTYGVKLMKCRLALKSTNYSLMAFIIDDDIIFCTVYKSLYTDIENWFDNTTIKDDEVSNVESVMLKHRDIVFSAYRSRSKTIPHYIDSLFTAQFRKLCLLAGSKLPKNHRLSGDCVVYFYNMMSGRVIEAEVTYDLCNSASRKIQESTISAIMLRGIYNLNDITDDMVNCMVSYIFNLTDTKQFIDKVTDDNYLDNLSNKENAFDENIKPCLEWQLSCALQKLKMDTLEKLNKDALKYLLETVFFSRSTKKLSDIKHSKQTGSIKLSDGTIITEYRVNSSRKVYNTNMAGGISNYFYIVGNLDESKSTCKIYNSHYSILNVLNLLYSLADSSKPGDTDISNDPTVNEFTPIGKILSQGVLGERLKGFKIYTAVCRGNGQAFLIMDINVSDSDEVLRYKVFRYRSLRECIKYAAWIYGELPEKDIKFSAKRLADDIYLIAANLLRSGGIKTDVAKVRSYIIDGYPNGYELCGNEKYLFDWAAKQRKKQ